MNKAIKLTRRERQVAFLALRHLSNKAIGIELLIKPESVERYLTKIYEKLGVPQESDEHAYRHMKLFAAIHHSPASLDSLLRQRKRLNTAIAALKKLTDEDQYSLFRPDYTDEIITLQEGLQYANECIEELTKDLNENTPTKGE